MNNQQIGEAVANTCKWTRDYNAESDYLYRTADGRGMFNPACCLNAMHEAEGALTGDKLEPYVGLLCQVLDRTTHNGGDNEFLRINATAAQRAEAFLRTIGKWEDGQ